MAGQPVKSPTVQAVISDGENDVERVSFKEGRIVIFKSNIWHRGEAPTDGHRVTLGAVYPLFKV